MTDALDRACEAAWEAVQRRRPAGDLERFGPYPWRSVKDSETGDAVRDSITAALRVMADEIRALRPSITGDVTSHVDRDDLLAIIDAYVGSNDD